MAKEHLVRKLTDLAEPLARSQGLALWGIELSSGPRQIVRIFLENDSSQPRAVQDDDENAPLAAQGVDVEQCALFSRLLGLSLDVEDILPGAYVLEVSSPGFERIFFTAAQLAGAVGQLIDLHLHEAPEHHPGRKKWRGTLVAGPVAQAAIPEDALFVLRLEAGVPQSLAHNQTAKGAATRGTAAKGKRAKDHEAAKQMGTEQITAQNTPEAEAEELVFSFANVKKARQVYIVPEKIRPGKGPKAAAATKPEAKPKKKQAKAAPEGTDKA